MKKYRKKMKKMLAILQIVIYNNFCVTKKVIK